MFPLVAVFMIIVAISLGNWSQFDFSCHGDIIACFWWNGKFECFLGDLGIAEPATIIYNGSKR